MNVMKSNRYMIQALGLIAAAVLTGEKGLSAEFAFTCQNVRPWPGASPANCEVRDLTEQYAGGTFQVIGAGAVRIRPSQDNRITARARIEIYAASGSGASVPTSLVAVALTPSSIRATGPSLPDGAWWQTSFELFVPKAAALDLTVKNGLVDLVEIDGDISLAVENGAIEVRNCAGSIKGSTRNGTITVETPGATNESVDLRTHNGGLHLIWNGRLSGRFVLKKNWGEWNVAPAFLGAAGIASFDTKSNLLAGTIGTSAATGGFALSTNNGNISVTLGGAR
jgi:hypothetical protein